jgi:uncharacterized repeat protein (TIGR02543 family)
MKKQKKLWTAICVILAVCTWLSACSSKGTKEVTGITVSKEPIKTAYSVGEAFSAEGGEITVTYSGGSTQTKSMTDSAVTLSEVNTTISGDSQTPVKKTVTVRFGGKSARFNITVSEKTCTVTLDYGQGKTENVAVKKDSKLKKPETSTSNKLVFDNWYTDSSLTTPYNFDTPVTGNFTLYAKWLDDAKYYSVTFAYNYDGAADTKPQKVKEGVAAVKPTTDPERKGYAFNGWYIDEAGTTKADFAAPVKADTTFYAKWNKTVSGRNWYTFEAEDVNLNGKTGPGLSGTAGGPGMIQLAKNVGASNDRFVGYQYDTGCSLEFQFNSDVDVAGAIIVIRLSAELRDFNLDPLSYKMALNGKDIDYGKISFTGVPKGSGSDVSSVNSLPFKDYTVITNASLKKGLNVFSVVTTNDEALSGTTMLAKAPLIDCIKIETDAILDWAAQLGLPKKNY